MQIRVVYHDGVKDIVGTTVEMFHLDDSATAASLLSRLGASHPAIMSQLNSYKLGRGGEAISQDAFLNDGDIIDISVSEKRTA
jgi:hypothetical protein